MTTFSATDKIDWVKKCSENIGVTETLGKTCSINKTESLAIAENIIKAFAVKKSETATITESIAKTFARKKNESFTIAESVIKTFGINKNESTGISDNIKKTFTSTKSETLTVAENIKKAFTAIKNESLAISDWKLIIDDGSAKHFYARKSESLDINDYIAEIAALELKLSETLGLVDTHEHAAVFSRKESEAFAIAEATVTSSTASAIPLPNGNIDIQTITSSGYTWTPSVIKDLINLHPHITISCISGTVVNPSISDGNKKLTWNETLSTGMSIILYPEEKVRVASGTETVRADGQWIMLKPNVIYTYTDETVGAFEVRVITNWEDNLYARTDFNDLLEEDLR